MDSSPDINRNRNFFHYNTYAQKKSASSHVNGRGAQYPFIITVGVWEERLEHKPVPARGA